MKNRKVTWANLELAGLLEDEESHVHFTRTTKHLSLHPYYLNNVQGGLNEILRSSLNTYDKELKGFILAFRNLKLLNNLGETLYDSPYIHIDVEADFYLFCPTNGTFLKGIVTKKGLDHIVVLVHKIYTVSIPKPDDTEEWAGDLVEIGQEVRCCVNEVDNRSKPPFIRATLRFDYSQGCRAPESINNIDNVDSAINSVKIEVSTGGVSEDNDVSEKERKKHQKKRKKSRESNSDFVVKVENELESNDNLESDLSRIVKSEKKRQSMHDTVLKTDDSINNLEVESIPKKHKKRKRLLLEEDTISANGVSEDTDASEKERKQHRKKHKRSREDNSNLVFKVENEESSANLGSDISTIVKSEKNHRYESMQDTILKTDDSMNNLEVDNIPKKHKRKRSLLEEDTISANGVPEDTDTSEKERKPHRKKHKRSREDNSNLVFKVENEESNANLESDISKIVKSEKNHRYESMQDTILKTDDSMNNLEVDNIPDKKHKKRKRSLLEEDTISANGVPEDTDTSEKERKPHRKKHKKSREDISNLVFKVENEESSANSESDISKIVKSEKKHRYQSRQDTILKTDDSMNNLEVDNIPKKHKKSRKSLLKEDTISANGASEDIDISEKERKQQRKKHKKSREDDSNIVIKVENEESSDNLGSNISKIVKSER